MIARNLWLKRQNIMDHEDQMTEERSEVDGRKNHVLQNDELFNELLKQHNDLAAIFDVEMTEATQHLKEKMAAIGKMKEQIQSYSRYIMVNDEELAEKTKQYNKTTQLWKTATTEYTIGLDEFVESGEVKDV